MKAVTDPQRLAKIAQHFTPHASITRFKSVDIRNVKENETHLVVGVTETFEPGTGLGSGVYRRTVKREKYLHIGGPLNGQLVATPEFDKDEYVGYSAHSWALSIHERVPARYVFIHVSMVTPS